MKDPCTDATPCEFIWAIQHTSPGSDVAMRPGQYDYPGARDNSLGVAGTVHGTPGAPRPVIKQTSTFPLCGGCPLLFVYGTLRNVVVDQSFGAGAIGATHAAIVDRTVLRGERAMYFGDVPGTGGVVRDSLLISSNGDALQATSGTSRLENVTAVARGLSDSTALRAYGPATVRAVNTILLGQGYDVVAQATSDGAAKVILDNSNYRPAKAQATGGSTIGGSNNQAGTPLFVSPTNFRERPGSPTINAGKSAGLTGPFDLGGLPRKLGPAVDIGAFEFAPSQGVSIGEQVTVAGGKANLRLTCPKLTQGYCSGKVTLRRKSDETKIGSTTFSLTRDTTPTVQVPLSAAVNNTLAGGGSVKAIARTVAHDDAGQQKTKGRELTLKR